MPGLLTVAECGERQQDLLDSIEAINELCKTEKREPDEKEQATIDSHLNEIDELEKDKAKAKRLEDMKTLLAKRQSPPVGLQLTDAPDVEDKPKKWDVPIRQLIYSRPKNFHGTVGGYSAEQRAYSAGQFFLALVGAQMPGRFPRFAKQAEWVKNNLGIDIQNVLGEGDGDTSGAGVFVPDQVTTDIIRLKEMYGVARRVFRMRPMTAETRTDPRESSQMTAYWTGENQAITESDPGYDDVKLVAKELSAITRYSRSLSADSAINLGDELTGQIAWAMAFAEDTAAFTGTGISTHGGILGVNTRLQDVDGAGTDSAGLVTQGTGSTWAAIVLADFENTVAKLPQFADTANTVWVCHRTFYYEVMLKLALASGGVPAQEISAGDRRARPTFLGYPVEFSQVMPSTTATTTVSATLGDFSIGASFGERSGMEISFSEQASVGGQSLWERNQIGIRAIERIDMNVHSVGSSSVVGPVVGLQTGS